MRNRNPISEFFQKFDDGQVLKLKNTDLAINLYGVEYSNLNDEDYLFANGYYFPNKSKENMSQRGLIVDDQFKHGKVRLTSVMDISWCDELICKGLPNFHPLGELTLPAFKVLQGKS